MMRDLVALVNGFGFVMHIFFFMIRYSDDLGHFGDGDEVRAPLPVIREALYDDAMMYGVFFFFFHFKILIFKYKC